MARQICNYCWLGRMDYLRARELQQRLAAAVAAGGPDILLFLEHPPTFTLGRRGGESNILVSRQTLLDRGAALIQTDRGGDITFHGPGQLVGYPIVDLARHGTGISGYLRMLEEMLIRALGCCEIEAGRIDGYTGVWVEQEKIAAIGVKITARRITQHGFALNVNTDLSYFGLITPCGIKDKGVTVLSRILGREVSLPDFSRRVAADFGEVFGREMIEIEPESLLAITGPEEPSK